jgi:hypothetical protein
MVWGYNIEPDHVDRDTAIDVVGALLSRVSRANVNFLTEPIGLDKNSYPPLRIAKLQWSSECLRPASRTFMAFETSEAHVGRTTQWGVIS